MTALAASPLAASPLSVPELVEAHEPPEARGRGRDDVWLLVAERGTGSLRHLPFRALSQALRAGDLLAVNTSATLAAALPGRLSGREVELRLSTPARSGGWVVELRAAGGEPLSAPPPGARIDLPEDGFAEITGPFPGSTRLTLARLTHPATLEEYLDRNGRPIRYGYVPERLPLSAYQTVFALEPGSAEMPSAGRPFTAALVTELVSRGILVAPITLHTGVSSPELGEPPFPERFDVPAATAHVVNAVHGFGGRVIAVGTTVARALETAAQPGGTVSPCRGWTSTVITPEQGVHAIDGLLTGWHDPRASHREILEAVGGLELIERSYREASTLGYRRHEFGDLHLILP